MQCIQLSTHVQHAKLMKHDNSVWQLEILRGEHICNHWLALRRYNSIKHGSLIKGRDSTLCLKFREMPMAMFKAKRCVVKSFLCNRKDVETRRNSEVPTGAWCHARLRFVARARDTHAWASNTSRIRRRKISTIGFRSFPGHTLPQQLRNIHLQRWAHLGLTRKSMRKTSCRYFSPSSLKFATTLQPADISERSNVSAASMQARWLIWTKLLWLLPKNFTCMLTKASSIAQNLSRKNNAMQNSNEHLWHGRGKNPCKLLSISSKLAMTCRLVLVKELYGWTYFTCYTIGLHIFLLVCQFTKHTTKICNEAKVEPSELTTAICNNKTTNPPVRVGPCISFYPCIVAYRW